MNTRHSSLHFADDLVHCFAKTMAYQTIHHKMVVFWRCVTIMICSPNLTKIASDLKKKELNPNKLG